MILFKHNVMKCIDLFINTMKSLLKEALVARDKRLYKFGVGTVRNRQTREIDLFSAEISSEDADQGLREDHWIPST